MSKINTLGLKEIFSEINLVDYNKNSKKKCILSKIKKYKNYKVVIIGDRDDGELEIAHQLRLDYVKVSLGGKYQDVKGKYKSSPVLEIKDEKDFVKIWEV
ncbi:MAG: hypothetical protein QM532_00380 [Cyanobium sp. MAG06]|nr:hypothetical protein [Cyanobium sp. MAG06]